MATTQVAPGVELTHPSSVRVDVLGAATGPTGLAGMRRMRTAPGETSALSAGLADFRPVRRGRRGADAAARRHASNARPRGHNPEYPRGCRPRRGCDRPGADERHLHLGPSRRGAADADAAPSRPPNPLHHRSASRTARQRNSAACPAGRTNRVAD